jgi:sigma-54 specific flagellar transcriptional regulator A
MVGTATAEALSHNRVNLEQVLVGAGGAIANLRSLVAQVAPKMANVLLQGESGTGKEVVARAIHDCSTRSRAPFVAVNCGAIPAELLESELFGHEKGAFTGAVAARKGRFELAEGGTLFLDEIGDMPFDMQVKLLRVLQERTFERVGGTKVQKANVRIVAATHQNLEGKVESGDFRMDLYYRLNVFPIDVPPLRDRPEDIPLLAQRFIDLQQEQNGEVISLSRDALTQLCQCEWQGNIRELGQSSRAPHYSCTRVRLSIPKSCPVVTRRVRQTGFKPHATILRR